ncbi:MAG TPA: hypothetical protein VGJ77_11280 [Gaiellaceae bacterium]
MTELPEPTWAFLARRGLPQFAAEGVAPVVVFYGAWKLSGLAAGVLAATACAGAVLVWQIRNGRDGALAPRAGRVAPRDAARLRRRRLRPRVGRNGDAPSSSRSSSGGLARSAHVLAARLVPSR